MQKITLDEYKRILCLNEVDMFYVSEPNSKLAADQHFATGHELHRYRHGARVQ